MNGETFQQRQLRRAFLKDMGAGFGSLALASMLNRDCSAATDGIADFAPKAKSVIWLFMIGGASHLESFDPKPVLNRYAGTPIGETPYREALKSPFLANERIVQPDPNNGHIRNKIFPLQCGFQRGGESGLEISDWFPHVRESADDLALVRSMWTEDSNHGAQLQFHTGRHRIDGFFPTVGAWATYGLGSLNENLPQFVVLGNPVADCCGGVEAHGGSYLGPRYDGVQLNIDPDNPLPYAKRPEGRSLEEQAAEFDLVRKLDLMTAERFPDDDALRARVKSYELAFRMQSAVPEVVDFSREAQHTYRLYGLDQKETRPFGEKMLAARRMVERGVRFIQVYHGGGNGAGQWDAHSGLKKSHSRLCRETDQPIGALLKDLKQRGLLDETLVVWATEFGRTPGSQHGTGRDHHPYGFSVWLAGGGSRGGVAHGRTDELGFHAIEDRHYVTDVHATVLHQMGLNHRELEVPGRKRIAKEFGEPIHAVLS
ncbi:DUF1501 domain-containing protein [Stratiformator vulcanicus]|uniref:Sulfatase n=1 Tax=Stratiformator vulcanicus TaxID=2527980 RepID=A0A517R576_9PLAN|nr:DUF1501 domain-containing protein [Stratiformator vulcanicus]QDT39041.1 hypothetical protein Pan189_34420 [Stratiformator vulcanicus]